MGYKARVKSWNAKLAGAGRGEAAMRLKSVMVRTPPKAPLTASTQFSRAGVSDLRERARQERAAAKKAEKLARRLAKRRGVTVDDKSNQRSASE